MCNTASIGEQKERAPEKKTNTKRHLERGTFLTLTAVLTTGPGLVSTAASCTIDVFKVTKVAAADTLDTLEFSHSVKL